MTTDLCLDKLRCDEPLRNNVPRRSRHLLPGDRQRLWFFQREARPRGGGISRWRQRTYVILDDSSNCGVVSVLYVCLSPCLLLLSLRSSSKHALCLWNLLHAASVVVVRFRTLVMSHTCLICMLEACTQYTFSPHDCPTCATLPCPWPNVPHWSRATDSPHDNSHHPMPWVCLCNLTQLSVILCSAQYTVWL